MRDNKAHKNKPVVGAPFKDRAELLNYIFEGARVIPTPSGGVVNLESDGLVYAVEVDDADLATIVATKDNEERLFALFDVPFPTADLPDGEKIALPTGEGWTHAEGTGTFYLFEEVFGVVEDPAEPAHEKAEAPTQEPADAEAKGGEEVAKFNDAVLLGAETPAFVELLEKDATFLIGELWGARDRRNTQDEHWNPVTMPWKTWITGGAATKNAAAWGFSRHPANKTKEGSCIVLGSSIGKARKAKAMETMFAMGIDIDSGAKLDDVLAKVEELGLFCIVYTSHSHGKSGIKLKRDEVLRKLKISGDPSLEEVRQYLREHDKNRYDEDFIAEIQIEVAKKQEKEGVKIILSTPPLDKFRLIFPLAEPINIIDLGETHGEALEVWENKITGLATETLGVHFDVSCTDPSRLFYTARHPKDAKDWYCAVVQGDPLKFEDVPTVRKSSYASSRGPLNAFEMAAEDLNGDRPPQCMAPSGASLNDWHSSAKDRFMMADLVQDYCAERIRPAGGESEGHVHIECPFEHEHSEEGGTATMVINSLDNIETGYWTWFCHHDSCQGRHKLQFLEEALRQGWFDEDQLFGDSVYLLEGDDEDEVDTADAIERAAGIDGTDGEKIRTFFRMLIEEGADSVVQANVIDDIAKRTALTKTILGDHWKSAAAEVAKKQRREVEAKRATAAPSPYVPLSEATEETVNAAAENAAWLPGFITYKAGWFYAEPGEPNAAPTRLCRAFEVPHVAFGDTEQGRRNEITIRYRHRSAQQGIVESVYAMGDAYRDPGALLSRLVDEGLEIHPQAKTPTIVTLLKAVNTDNEAVLIDKAGWQGDAYVSPAGVVVNGGDVQYILNPRKRVSGATRGDLETHRQYATTALTGINGKLFLPGYLSGLVGCMVDFIGNDVSPVVMLEGSSTTGKTSSLKAGAAHFGPPDHTGLFVKADATATATENYAERSNAAVLALDEEGTSKLSAEEKQRLVLQWADGAGRLRANRDSTAQRVRTWRTCFTTSAERGFLNRLTAEGGDPLTGAVARILSVNVDSAANLDPGPELDALRALSGDDPNTATYGITGPVFAAELARIGRDEVRARVSAKAEEWVDLATGAARRVVRLAALFCVAGEIAREAGIIGEVPVREHVRALLEETLDARMQHLNTDQQQTEALRRAVLSGLRMGTILTIHEDHEAKFRETVGYYGHLAANGRPDNAAMKKHDPTGADMAEREARTYILPRDRLGGLGITTDHKALAERLDKVGALVTRKKGDRTEWQHDYVPGEGSGIKNIRVTGAFIHGAGAEDD